MGRPLPHGAVGVQPPAVIGGRPTAQKTLIEAQRLLDGDRPFHAHEVLEDAWKVAPEAQQALWRGLAQLAVGLTHLARGNSAGAVALLKRGAENIAAYRGEPCNGIDVVGLTGWAQELADAISSGSARTPGQSYPSLFLPGGRAP